MLCTRLVVANLLLAGVTGGFVGLCHSPVLSLPFSQVVTDSNSQPPIHKLTVPHLPNAIQIHEKVISGGLPEGEPAFEELAKLGIKTIISVDGTKPDVVMAKKYSMRYVHLPHGYDGISQPRIAELAKAVRDFDGPIYIHCHHGKHRSPAAAVVACVSNGMLDPTKSSDVLKLAGTSPHYTGLFLAANSAKQIDAAELDALKVEFPEVAKLPPMAEAMVALEHTHDKLKRFASSRWQPIPQTPSVDAANEALLMAEHFTELARQPWIKDYPMAFKSMVEESRIDSKKLEDGLRIWIGENRAQVLPSSIDEAFNRVSANCTACHQSYRDKASPLGK